MSRVLVTGAAGFLGSHLCERLLEAQDEVVGIDSFSDYYDPAIKRANLSRCLAKPGFELVETDLCSADLGELLEGVSTVFHLAAQPGVRASWGSEFRVYTESNIGATQVLLEAAKEMSPQPRIVNSSSSSVYGVTDRLPMQEGHLPRPHSPYGVTKMAAEHLCRLYMRNYGLRCLNLRYFTVYGPRQRADMAFHRFFNAAIKGDSIEVFGDGNQTRDFTFVDDAIEANLLARTYEGGHDVFNIGGGSRVALKEAVETIYDLLGMAPKIDYKNSVHGDVLHTWADTALARAELGFEPRVDLKKGLERQMTWQIALARGS